MAILPILRYPDPRLHTRARHIEHIDDALRQLAADMAETMYAAPGVGLAATQVDHHVQLVVIDVSEDKTDLMTLINPEIIAREGECEGEEGCLSAPGQYGLVSRHKKVTVEAINRHGKRVTLDLKGFPAVVFQHEIDHLNGILFIDKASKLTKSGSSRI
jgi:peptide deformylase